MSAISAYAVFLSLAAGVALGTAYFASLLYATRLYALRFPFIRIVPLYLARIAVASAVFWSAARWGALALMLVLLGFLVGRGVTQYAGQYWGQWEERKK